MKDRFIQVWYKCKACDAQFCVTGRKLRHNEDTELAMDNVMRSPFWKNKLHQCTTYSEARGIAEPVVIDIRYGE